MPPTDLTTATKIAVLGGSSVGTPELVTALQRLGPPARPIHVVLHGRTMDKLGPVAHAAHVMAKGTDWLQVSATTTLESALEGADYVINQVRVGGLAARAFDETFPITLGIPGEETVGPGGFANALRTVPVVVELAQIIERLAPNALLLSFTNPASVIQYAVTRTSRLKVIGLCDAPITMMGWAAAALGVPASALVIDYVGMHHFGFITRAQHDGRDVTADMLAGLERVTGFEIDLDYVRALGVLPTPYLRYFVHADRVLDKQRGQKQSRAEQLMQLEAELVAEYAAATERPAGLARRGAKWYDVIIAPVLMALIEKRTETFIINLTNEGVYDWLPADAIIETSCLVQGGVLRPLRLPPPSLELQARIHANCTYEQLMVDAILEGSEAKALRALTLNPLIPNVATARQVLRLLWPDADPANANTRGLA
jgi:6-phospho-beta-glucosidase